MTSLGWSVGRSVLLAGRGEEEHHRGGVVGEVQTEAVLLACHDQERLCVLHLGLPEDQPALRGERNPPPPVVVTIGTSRVTADCAGFFFHSIIKHSIRDLNEGDESRLLLYRPILEPVADSFFPSYFYLFLKFTRSSGKKREKVLTDFPASCPNRSGGTFNPVNPPLTRSVKHSLLSTTTKSKVCCDAALKPPCTPPAGSTLSSGFVLFSQFFF